MPIYKTVMTGSAYRVEAENKRRAELAFTRLSPHWERFCLETNTSINDRSAFRRFAFWLNKKGYARKKAKRVKPQRH